MSTGGIEYLEFSAPPAVAEVVRCVWLLSGPASATLLPQPVVPDGCAEVVLNLAAPFLRLGRDGAWETQPRAMVVGQTTEAVVIAPTGAVDIVGIRLQPWGALSVLPAPAIELRDVLLPLAALHVEMARDLPDELREQLSAASRAAAVFRFVARHLRRDAAPSRSRARAIVAEATRAQPAAATVRALAARLGLGERQVERELTRHVGLRPKMLLRIARFQRALALARTDDTLTWSAVAAGAGYFDQAHLTHEFRRFAACTPSQFSDRDRSLTDLFLAE